MKNQKQTTKVANMENRLKTSFFLMQKITAPLCNYHKETSCLCIGVVDLQIQKGIMLEWRVKYHNTKK